jgi:hypothetical protein
MIDILGLKLLRQTKLEVRLVCQKDMMAMWFFHSQRMLRKNKTMQAKMVLVLLLEMIITLHPNRLNHQQVMGQQVIQGRMGRKPKGAKIKILA